MWSGQNKVWLNYRKDIMAADVDDAIFLSKYLRHIAIHKIYISSLEVYDLQRYKVLNDAKKVRVTLQDRLHIPFIFIAGRN